MPCHLLYHPVSSLKTLLYQTWMVFLFEDRFAQAYEYWTLDRDNEQGGFMQISRFLVPLSW